MRLKTSIARARENNAHLKAMGYRGSEIAKMSLRERERLVAKNMSVDSSYRSTVGDGLRHRFEIFLRAKEKRKKRE